MKRLIIVADDLAGAADCGVPFAVRGLATRAVLDAEGIDAGDWAVIALDTDSRATTPREAAARVRRALRGLQDSDVLFKKVDSTLRGHLATELAEVLAARPRACLVAAPAFPATGRTTEGGRQRLDGRPLEATEFAQQGAESHLLDVLAPAGRALAHVSLEQVRGGEVAALVRDAARRVGGLVCDAVSAEDLQTIAIGALDAGVEVVWLGSAGLAHALAASVDPRAPDGPPVAQRSSAAFGLPTRPAEPPRRRAAGGPLLLVVGSPARATRAQLERLRQDPDTTEVALAPGAEPAGRDEAVAAVRAQLSAGRDCALTLGGQDGTREAGRDGSAALATVAAGAAELAGGLVLTGGETARATLAALSVHALSLAGEIEPGIAFGHSDDRRALPVAIKAGGFGSEEALVACRHAMGERETVEART